MRVRGDVSSTGRRSGRPIGHRPVGGARATGSGRRAARGRSVVVVGLAAVLAGAACSSTSSPPAAAPATSVAPGTGGTAPAGTGTAGTAPGSPGSTATTAPARWSAATTSVHEVNPGLRQGLARGDGGVGWVLSTNNALYRTDDAFVATSPPGEKLDPAIPPELAAKTFDHIGDIDIADGVLWAPIEKGDKAAPDMVLARYDARTLAYRDSFVLPQHHAAFVTIDEQGVLWSTDQFDDDTLQRYRLVGASLEKLAPLKMSQKVAHIQGGDIAAGAMWLSTDDDHDGLYRVDLATGSVQEIGTTGYADGEGEGDDAQPGAAGAVTMAVLAADAKLIPMRVIILQATKQP